MTYPGLNNVTSGYFCPFYGNTAVWSELPGICVFFLSPKMFTKGYYYVLPFAMSVEASICTTVNHQVWHKLNELLPLVWQHNWFEKALISWAACHQIAVSLAQPCSLEDQEDRHAIFKSILFYSLVLVWIWHIHVSLKMHERLIGIVMKNHVTSTLAELVDTLKSNDNLCAIKLTKTRLPWHVTVNCYFEPSFNIIK